MLRLLLCFVALAMAVAQQSPPKAAAFNPPRLADGHPDLHGIYISGSISAAFNVEDHPATYGSRAGPSVISDPPDKKLPYRPGFRERAEDNDRHRERDPVAHCHMHGVPRGMFPPFPMEIAQDGNYFLILSEVEHSVRIIPTDGSPHRKNYRSWVGDSRGHWEGDTLVVDTTGMNGKTWLDEAGNFVSENAHAVERFTMTGPDTIAYTVTVDDPTVFTRPWTISMDLRRRPADMELLEYGCVEGERDAEHYPTGERK